MRRGWVGLIAWTMGCGDLVQAVGSGEDESTSVSGGATDASSGAPSTTTGVGDGTAGASDGVAPGTTSGMADATTSAGVASTSTSAASTASTGGDAGSTGGPAATPETCAEVGAAQPGLPDGEYTLYVGGNAAQPWTAYCVDLDGSAQAYLPLPAGAANNYGEYANTGSGVRTEYSRVAIDELTLEVDIDDMTFAASVGSLMHGPDTVTEMSYGVAMACINGVTATAKVDLTGTPFTVTGSWCTAGSSAVGQALPSAGGHVVDITGGGYCGWSAPDLPSCPYNPYNGGTGNVITLQYAP